MYDERIDSVLLAKYIIKQAQKKGIYDMSITKLQKLLYALDGGLLAHDINAVDEHCQAWQYGPVYPKVFTKINPEDFNKNYDNLNIDDIDSKEHSSTIKKMVEAGQDIEVQDTASLRQTALGWAAFIGYLDVVQYLIEQGANLYAGDTADVTSAFKSAILGGNIKVIEYLYPLYQGKLNLNEQDKRDGETMLMVAAGNNREDAVKFLLDKKVDVNIVSKQLNKSAYTYACESRNQNIIKMIKDAGGINVRTGKASCQ